MTENGNAKKKYNCIFFDLDHTLWDYEKNLAETMVELYDQYDLKAKGVSTSDQFTEQFKDVNTKLWVQYDSGAITSDVIRTERFKLVMEPFGVKDQKLCEDLSRDTWQYAPKRACYAPYH